MRRQDRNNSLQKSISFEDIEITTEEEEWGGRDNEQRGERKEEKGEENVLDVYIRDGFEINLNKSWCSVSDAPSSKLQAHNKEKKIFVIYSMKYKHDSDRQMKEREIQNEQDSQRKKALQENKVGLSLFDLASSKMDKEAGQSQSISHNHNFSGKEEREHTKGKQKEAIEKEEIEEKRKKEPREGDSVSYLDKNEDEGLENENGNLHKNYDLAKYKSSIIETTSGIGGNTEFNTHGYLVPSQANYLIKSKTYLKKLIPLVKINIEVWSKGEGIFDDYIGGCEIEVSFEKMGKSITYQLDTEGYLHIQYQMVNNQTIPEENQEQIKANISSSFNDNNQEKQWSSEEKHVPSLEIFNGMRQETANTIQVTEVKINELRKKVNEMENVISSSYIDEILNLTNDGKDKDKEEKQNIKEEEEKNKEQKEKKKSKIEKLTSELLAPNALHAIHANQLPIALAEQRKAIETMRKDIIYLEKELYSKRGYNNDNDHNKNSINHIKNNNLTGTFNTTTPYHQSSDYISNILSEYLRNDLDAFETYSQEFLTSSSALPQHKKRGKGGKDNNNNSSNSNLEKKRLTKIFGESIVDQGREEKAKAEAKKKVIPLVKVLQENTKLKKMLNISEQQANQYDEEIRNFAAEYRDINDVLTLLRLDFEASLDDGSAKSSKSHSPETNYSRGKDFHNAQDLHYYMNLQKFLLRAEKLENSVESVCGEKVQSTFEKNINNVLDDFKKSVIDKEVLEKISSHGKERNTQLGKLFEAQSRVVQEDLKDWNQERNDMVFQRVLRYKEIMNETKEYRDAQEKILQDVLSMIQKRPTQQRKQMKSKRKKLTKVKPKAVQHANDIDADNDKDQDHNLQENDKNGEDSEDSEGSNDHDEISFHAPRWKMLEEEVNFSQLLKHQFSLINYPQSRPVLSKVGKEKEMVPNYMSKSELVSPGSKVEAKAKSEKSLPDILDLYQTMSAEADGEDSSKGIHARRRSGKTYIEAATSTSVSTSPQSQSQSQNKIKSTTIKGEGHGSYSPSASKLHYETNTNCSSRRPFESFSSSKERDKEGGLHSFMTIESYFEERQSLAEDHAKCFGEKIKESDNLFKEIGTKKTKLFKEQLLNQMSSWRIKKQADIINSDAHCAQPKLISSISTPSNNIEDFTF